MTPREHLARAEVLLYGYDNHLGKTKAAFTGHRIIARTSGVGEGTCRPRLTTNQLVSCFHHRVTSVA